MLFFLSIIYYVNYLFEEISGPTCELLEHSSNSTSGNPQLSLEYVMLDFKVRAD